MKNSLLSFVLLFVMFSAFSQTKVSGYVYDKTNEPVAFANVIFRGSTEGTITNENGKFYLESDEAWEAIQISFIGYETVNLELSKRVNYDLKIVINEIAEALNEVVIVTGKQSKKNNPAIDILRKIWERKRSNGLNQFNQ